MSTDTAPASFPWALPPVTATYATPHARLRAFTGRVKRSAFAADIQRGLQNRFLPGIGALFALFVGLLVFRGLIVAADMMGLVR